MRIIRTDLKTGRQSVIAIYEGIGLLVGKEFMEYFANQEADNRSDVDHVALRSTNKGEFVNFHATLLGKNNASSLVEYSLVVSDVEST